VIVFFLWCACRGLGIVSVTSGVQVPVGGSTAMRYNGIVVAVLRGVVGSVFEELHVHVG